MYYPSGKEIIYNIFIKPTRCVAIVNLLMILTKVYALNQYDDTLFRKEFSTFIPDIEQVLKGTVLEDSIIRWIALGITTNAFITAIRSYLDTTTECKLRTPTPHEKLSLRTRTPQEKLSLRTPTPHPHKKTLSPSLRTRSRYH